MAAIFGLVMAILMATAGVAVDFARWLNARSMTLAAVDAAVLAGVRALQLEGASSTVAAYTAERYYQRKVARRLGVVDDQVGFVVADGGTAVVAQGRAVLETIILKLCGLESLTVAEFSSHDRAQGVLAKGIHARQSIELALTLDVSSSVTGTRLDDLKAAAKDLTDIVVWDAPAGYEARAALVPFSEGVMVSPAIYSDAWQLGPDRVEFPLGVGVSMPWLRAGNCFAERKGPDAFTDAAPDSGDRRFVGVYTWAGRCRPQQPLVPLTSERSILRSSIDALAPGGGTAIQAGIAWAWYALSPAWADVLPSGSTPESCQLLSQRGPGGVPLLRKIAVLVTDGESTTEYCANGVRAARVGRENVTADCVAMNGPSATQARALCAGMKSRGIEVYAIALALAGGSEAGETMRQCATSSDHLYRPADGVQLRQAFRDVALKISSIHLQL